eukprot:GILI01036713.1.p1 GENE.GILI01036713.1~~GILI01036713.1.p1  ORF type:complete len:141 (-),score=19.71 GILI01036713.1:36-458(-)
MGAIFLEPQLAAQVLEYQIHYGTSVLSFMGAVHWGLEMSRIGGPNPVSSGWTRLSLSTVPSLTGWVASCLASTNPFASQCILISSFLGVLAGDASTHGRLSPAWYIRLRVPLTLGVSCFLALPMFFGPTKKKDEHIEIKQ